MILCRKMRWKLSVFIILILLSSKSLPASAEDNGQHASCRQEVLSQLVLSLQDEDFVLSAIEECIRMNRMPAAAELLGLPMEYSARNQIRHTVFLCRTLMRILPDTAPDLVGRIEYSDSVLTELKATGEDVKSLEISFLNEAANVYGILSRTDDVIAVMDRLGTLCSDISWQDKEWPADAFLAYGVELFRGRRFQEAGHVLENVAGHKLVYDLRGIYPVMTYLSGLYKFMGRQEDTAGLMDRILGELDQEMSRQGILQTTSSFDIYFPDDMFMDMMSFASDVCSPDCNGVLYDAILTLTNLKKDISLDLLAYADTSSDAVFRTTVRLVKYAEESSFSDLAESAYTEIMDSLRIGDLVRSHRYSWKDVKSSLKSHELAVEFIMVPAEDPFYAALVVGRGYRHPALVRLCKVKDIQELARRGPELYRNGAGVVYMRVWKPLEPYLHGVRRIFYAAKGALGKINMDAVTIPMTDCLMSEKYSMNLLSSTASLLDRDRDFNYRKPAGQYGALLFGGLDYYPDEDAWYDAGWFGRVRRSSDPDFMMDRSDYSIENLLTAVPADTSRAGVSFLKHTRDEVETIAGVLPPFAPVLRTGLQGIEEEFRLRYPDMKIMHFATHAFYFDEEDVHESGRLAGKDISYVHTKAGSAMKRCGLLMSGAGNTVLGRKPDGVFDGLVFGEDIAARDFRNVDLVVLSACGTASGDDSGNSIYGLQRAFKMSGARTVVMSLWNVNDEATSLMMKSFYTFLMSGDPKREAFRRAMMTVREKYRDPYYWAPFIMMD